MKRSAFHIQTLIYSLGLLCAMAALLLFPKEASGAVVQSLHVCGTLLLPSLFPFFVCVNLFLALRLTSLPARLLSRVMVRLFHLPEQCASALVLGLLGGYPAGAHAAGQLLAQGEISPAVCTRLLRFCNNAGPGFIFGVAGVGIFGSIKLGALLYLIHALCAVLCGMLLRPAAPILCAARTHASQTSRAPQSFAVAFTASVRTAGQTALQVCMFVVVFGVLSRFLQQLLPTQTPDSVHVLLGGMLELGNGASLLREAALSFPARFAIAAFLLGFGGISVWAQTASLFPSPAVLRGYLGAKLLHGALSAAAALLAQRLLSLDALCAPAFSAAVPVQAVCLLSPLLVTLYSFFAIFRNLMAGNLRAKGV